MKGAWPFVDAPIFVATIATIVIAAFVAGALTVVTIVAVSRTFDELTRALGALK
jgi:archaellum component FlaG (FlaF/FlaG flagellin family)